MLLDGLQNNYDPVAEDYALAFRHELERKPFDRKMLDLLMEKVGGLGPICDLGCGGGQVAGYLRAHGGAVSGVDLSPRMVEQARRLNPDVPFAQGDMLALTTVPDASFAGVAAFYSIIHIPPESIGIALRETKRILCSGGTVLLTFHIGQKIVHLDEWWEKRVSLDFYFFETQGVKDALIACGFELEEVIEREPYPEIEVQTRRAYIFARNP
jgi:SAM-dependent methyltransferase